MDVRTFDLINDRQPITFARNPLEYYEETILRLTKERESEEYVDGAQRQIHSRCKKYLEKLDKENNISSRKFEYSSDEVRIITMAFTACYLAWKNEAILFPASKKTPRDYDYDKAYELGIWQWNSSQHKYEFFFDDPTTIYAQVEGKLQIFLLAFNTREKIVNQELLAQIKMAKSIADLLVKKCDGRYPVINIPYFTMYLRKIMSKYYNDNNTVNTTIKRVYGPNNFINNETIKDMIEDDLVDGMIDYFNSLEKISRKCIFPLELNFDF